MEDLIEMAHFRPRTEPWATTQFRGADSLNLPEVTIKGLFER